MRRCVLCYDWSVVPRLRMVVTSLRDLAKLNVRRAAELKDRTLRDGCAAPLPILNN